MRRADGPKYLMSLIAQNGHHVFAAEIICIFMNAGQNIIRDK